MKLHPLYLTSLRGTYLAGEARPADIINEVYRRIGESGRDDIWIHLRTRHEALEIARELADKPPESLPFYGIPFSVKDNIDVQGLPTTAGCPGYEYQPPFSASVVALLEAAGAICVGKTNMDQFATGLTGTRSPYAACGSAFDRRMPAGGSSSGSAASVGLHLVCFSLGTDTGGSGRIPAALNNVVGLKPTLGTLSMQGIVPCCPSLDCPSVFALSVEDALAVAQTMYVADRQDPSLRDNTASSDFGPAIPNERWALLAPNESQLEFFSNPAGLALYKRSLRHFEEMGCSVRRIDFQPFIEAGNLLFDGPWIAERYTSIGEFVEQHQPEVLPEIIAIIQKSKQWNAADVFRTMAKLRRLKTQTRSLFDDGSILVTPTVAPLYSIADILADPIERNTHQGHYSYFANILDLCGLAIPADFYPNGIPFGVTLFAPAFHDIRLAGLAGAWLRHRSIVPGVPQ